MKQDDHSKKDGEFNSSDIPMKKWADWELSYRVRCNESSSDDDLPTSLSTGGSFNSRITLVETDAPGIVCDVGYSGGSSRLHPTKPSDRLSATMHIPPPPTTHIKKIMSSSSRNQY